MKPLIVILTAGLLSLSLTPAVADPWKDESGHGRHHDKKGPPPHARHGAHPWEGPGYRGRGRGDGRDRQGDAPYWRVSVDLGGVLGAGRDSEWDDRHGRNHPGEDSGGYCYEERYDESGRKYRVELEPWQCRD